MRCGVEPREIGVVTPYRAQAREIRNLLRLGEGGRELVSKVVVDTVERMQGQERDVIIISLTTSDAGFAANLAEFLFQPQRLNVAVTRPRRKLVIVGSRHLLDIKVEEPEIEAGMALMEELLQDCDSVSLSPEKSA